MTEVMSGDLVDERPVDGQAVDLRQIMPAPALRELIAEVGHVLTEVQATGAGVDRQAVFVALYFAPRLAELRADVEDARFELNRALHAAVTEPGVPLEGEIRRALRVYGVSEDRLLDACVVAVRRTLPSLASELADELADEQLRVQQAGTELARQMNEVQSWSTLARRRHEVAQRLREELVTALVDAEQYRSLTPQSCPVGLHDGWLVDSEHQHACPWCLIAERTEEVERLRAHLAECHRLQNNVAAVVGVETDWDAAGRKAVLDAVCRMSGNLDDARMAVESGSDGAP